MSAVMSARPFLVVLGERVVHATAAVDLNVQKVDIAVVRADDSKAASGDLPVRSA